MAKKLFAGSINIYYGQFYIQQYPQDNEDYCDIEESFAEQRNGLCGAGQQTKLFMIVGPQDGAIELQVELCKCEPDLLPGYGDIVQCWFVNSGKNLHIVEWGDEAHYQLDLPDGNYALRYSIQGMDLDYPDDSMEQDFASPVAGQQYKLQFWPAQQADEGVIKCSSEVGKYWHSQTSVGQINNKR